MRFTTNMAKPKNKHTIKTTTTTKQSKTKHIIHDWNSLPNEILKTKQNKTNTKQKQQQTNKRL